MNRFRKRSDPKRAHIPALLREPHPHPTEPLPPLPPESDFRTSLILPDLTRRFSVLRNSSGEPIGVDELKSRFEALRARGSQNRVSESEEDMILEALSRLRPTNGRQKSNPEGSIDSTGDNLVSTYSDDLDGTSRNSVAPSLAGGQSVRSNTTTSSGLHASPSIASISSTKGSQASRRMSNNLFGSGKFHDYTYMRTAHYQRRTPTSPNTAKSSPMKHTDSVASMSTLTSSRAGHNYSIYSDSQSLRPVTPEGSAYTNSVPSSPNKTSSTRDEASDHAFDFQGLGTGFGKALSPDVIGRASLALDEVIRELEEEGDDQVLVERSPIAVTPNNHIQPAEPSPLSASPPSSPGDEPGMAFSSDEQVIADEVQRTSPYPRSRTSSPIPRLPGYIPGMPRPMTPRETPADADDQTPSATPRATSPRLPGVSPPPPPSLAQSFSSIHRTNSNASTSRTSRPTSPTTPVSPSPLFFNRTPQGRFTPEDRHRNGSTSPAPDPIDSPVLGRRRPLSPLSGAAFQPMTPVPPSRPTTPSNITWNPPSSPNGRVHGRNGSTSASGHSRNGSVVSVTDNLADSDQPRSSMRSLRSPPLPDSPWVDVGHASTTSLLNNAERPPSAMSGMELGSPLQMSNRSLRSPTPTHGAAHSPPTSPAFPDQGPWTNGNASRRSSRQNNHSSFTVSQSHALLLSPIGNSSRSSLESAGSSYHSWDEDHSRDRLFNLFSHLDPETEWHDFSKDISSSSTSRTTPLETHESEEIVRRQMGLSKSDMVTIQDKLVTAALTKAATPEGRHRANSVRKRRPSTSQSNYSYNGGDSRVPTPAPAPAPQPQAPVTSGTVAHAPRSPNSGQIALLDAVVDSIESPRRKAVAIPQQDEARKTDMAVPTLQSKVSSPTMRQRALAEVLFGSEDQGVMNTAPQLPIIRTPDIESTADHEKGIIASAEHPSMESKQEAQKEEVAVSDFATPVTPGPPSNSSHSHIDATLLALDVQRRAEAATAALRKSPSIPKMADNSSTRKRISPSQISSPKLLSASTSVDTIPLPSVQTGHLQAPSNVSSTKRSFRFKLKGPLRTKAHGPAGDEVTPYPLDLRTPPSTQTATFTPSLFGSGGSHGLASAIEPSRPKVSPPVVPSPPASATPGLRGFMSLFRKQRHAGHVDIAPPSERRGTPLSPPQMIPTSAPPRHQRIPSPPQHQHQHQPQSQSAPPEQSQYVPLRPFSPQSPLSASFPSSEAVPEDPTTPPQSAPPISSEAALRQLFDAANDLGLDQDALTDLVARSPSLSSRPAIRTKSRSNSVADNRQSTRPDGRESTIPQSPLPSEGRLSVDAISPRPSAEIRQLTIRKNLESTPALRSQQATPDPTRAIVRRTIIVPSDTKVSAMDLNALNALMRKQSLTRRRRSGGATSITSTRSLQDRAPTPPPPRASSKRFSTDKSPPVPQLPSVHPTQLDTPTPAQVEQSNSTYEMYASDSKSAIPEASGMGNSQPAMDEESGPAVEVIELANGETIWSIVNGLRDDDAESFYDSRRSFASDYSGEGVKVFFKEHGRKGSKSSNTSFLSRKKQLHPSSSSNRPETKVFFSSSAQIGRLIENLSRDLDAGSFNITPDHTHVSHAGHSTSSSVGSASDARWTLEERLEHMLGSMSTPP